MQVPLSEAERTARDSRDGRLAAGVGIEYGDGLVLICEVPDHRLGQDVKGAPQEYVIGGGAQNVDLKIESDGADEEGNISRQSKRLVNSTVRRHHMQANCQVIA